LQLCLPPTRNSASLQMHSKCMTNQIKFFFWMKFYWQWRPFQKIPVNATKHPTPPNGKSSRWQ
jgi:hypothetical protein